MTEVKKKFELDIINLIKRGFNPSKIATHLNISLPNLSYYLSSLKREGVIKKVGYGTWIVIPSGEVKILSHKGSTQVKDVRGHAFIWKIKTNRKFNWIEILKNNKIDYQLKGIAKTPRVVLNQRKVWLGSKYITIYEITSNSFFGSSTIESKKNAVLEMINTIELLKKVLNIEFSYKFTCKRQHYGFIKNLEAKEFLKENKKLLIKDKEGYWFSIDNSQNMYEEAETISEKTADLDGIGYKNLMNDYKATNFQVTPSFVLKGLHKLSSSQLNQSKQIESFAVALNRHIPAYEGMKNEVSALNKTIKELKKEIKKLKRV